jgi:hypothetical protein
MAAARPLGPEPTTIASVGERGEFQLRGVAFPWEVSTGLLNPPELTGFSGLDRILLRKG